MNDTDFDLLCDGANPQEAKRLRKLLAEWCSGDENSFPVQLALLTKAQWRAVAQLPRIVKDSQKQFEQAQASHRDRLSTQFDSAMEDARRLVSDSKKLLDAVQADHRRQIAAQSQSTIEAMGECLKTFDSKLSVYNDIVSNIAIRISSNARELEAVERQYRGQLKQGAESWNQAKADFDAARQEMNEERKKLEERVTLQSWIYHLLFFLLCLTLGFVLGKFWR